MKSPAAERDAMHERMRTAAEGLGQASSEAAEGVEAEKAGLGSVTPDIPPPAMQESMAP